MFRFIKKVFFIRLTILSSFTSVNSLSCISMNNQACKDLKLLMLREIILYFILFVLKQANVAAIVIILMIHMR